MVGAFSLSARDLSKLSTEPGQPIPAPLCDRLEALLGAPFSRVTLHASISAAKACGVLDAAAFAYDEHVFLGPEALHPAAPSFVALLAHELAHVVQQRRGKDPTCCGAPVPLLEREADLAAEAALAGARFEVRLADPYGAPATWNLAGHYFITYLMFLNAGVEAKAAQRIALWCWLPDQVQEFDAAHVGFNWVKNIVLDVPVISLVSQPQWRDVQDNFKKYEPEGDTPAGQPGANKVVQRRVVPTNAQTHLEESQYVRAVHSGLHVLNGENGAQEAKRRATQFLTGGHLPPLFRALSLHAFGDCFSHTRISGIDSDTLWGPTVLGLPVGHGLDGHASDDLWNEQRWANVCAYIRALGKTANEYNRSNGIVPLDDIVAALSPILQGPATVMDLKDAKQTWKAVVPDWSKISDKAKTLARTTATLRSEDACATHIRNVSAQLVGKQMSPPEFFDEPAPWRRYFDRYSADVTQDAGDRDGQRVFYKIQKCAAEWSGNPLGRRLSDLFPSTVPAPSPASDSPAPDPANRPLVRPVRRDR